MRISSSILGALRQRFGDFDALLIVPATAFSAKHPPYLVYRLRKSRFGNYYYRRNDERHSIVSPDNDPELWSGLSWIDAPTVIERSDVVCTVKRKVRVGKYYRYYVEEL